MLAFDEDALICDFAETYHLFDWRQLPLRTAASLACGLRDNSRIKVKMSGSEADLDRLLLASINDAVNLIWWSKTDDGQNGINRPTSVLGILTGGEERRTKNMSFDSGEEFDAMYQKIVRGG